MPARSSQARVSESGRLSIPADIRRDMGIEKGGLVNLVVDDEGVRIATTEQFRRRVQRIAREDGWHKAGNVDDFLEWRHEEGRREQKEAGNCR